MALQTASAATTATPVKARPDIQLSIRAAGDRTRIVLQMRRRTSRSTHLAPSNFCPTGKSKKPVQPHCKKFFACAVGQISDLTPPVSPDKRGGSRSSRNARWDAVDVKAA